MSKKTFKRLMEAKHKEFLAWSVSSGWVKRIKATAAKKAAEKAIESDDRKSKNKSQKRIFNNPKSNHMK